MGVRGFTEQWFRSSNATCFTASCGGTSASCRARPVVSTVLTVTADSCSHVMGTGAVRMRKWNRWREGADAEWWREPRCGRWWMRMREWWSGGGTGCGWEPIIPNHHNRRAADDGGLFFGFWQCLPLCCPVLPRLEWSGAGHLRCPAWFVVSLRRGRGRSRVGRGRRSVSRSRPGG